MNEASNPRTNEMHDLLQLINACPVGLVAFTEDGTVTQINPEASHLIFRTWALSELRNIKIALLDPWPDFSNVVNFNIGVPGKLIENHRLVGGTPEAPSALSLTVVRMSSTQYLLTIADDTANLGVVNALGASDSRLQTLFDSIDEGYCLCEMITADGEPIDYRFLRVNPLFEEMTGLVDPAGKTALELVPGLEREWIETYARAGLKRESIRFEQGSEAMGRWFDVFATPVEPLGHFAIVFKDQTARRQAERALQNTASYNAFRARLIDTLRTRQTAAELQVQSVALLRDRLNADRVLYAEIGERGEIDVSAAQSSRTGIQALTGRYRLDWQGPELTADFTKGTTVVVRNIETEPRLTEQTRAGLRQIQFASYVMVPLMRQHRLVATMVAHHGVPHEWSQDEIDLVEETALRTILAVEQTNEDETKRLRYERAELMAEMLSSMEAASSLDDQAQNLARALVPGFADHATVEVPGANGVFLGAAQAPFSHLSVPIDLSGGVRGKLTVGITDFNRTSFDKDDLVFLQEAVNRAGVVMAATRLRKEEHQISIRLQQALLPDQVVWHNNVVIEARYSAASAFMEVGGDWYDTFSWPNGKIGLLVGDVLGHNLESAAQMGRLRAGTAAMALSTGSSPAALLDALQGFARGPGGTKFTTASCLVIDPGTGELTYSSAGHLPVLVVSPEGQVLRLDQALTPPICSIDVGSRPEATLFVQPNSLVLMYSDGLIEQRGEGIDDGLSRLESAVVKLLDTPIEDFANKLIAAMAGQSLPEDDVVVVCFRFDPAHAIFHRSLAPQVNLLRELRTELRGWLSGHHPNFDVHNDVLLAATEACTNAIEHAYTNGKMGSVIVDVSSHDRHVVLRVADQGMWQPNASTNHDRGRGTSIMQSVSERFTRTSTDQGTTVEMVFPKAM